MFVPDVEFAKWSMRTAPDSSYKGVYLQKLRADLTRTADPDWEWNHFNGVLSRTDNSSVFGFDPDRIAKGLLGKGATRADLESVERVLDALKNNRGDINTKVRDAYRTTLAPRKPGEKPDPNAPQIDEGKDADRASEALAFMRQKTVASAYAKAELIRDPRLKNNVLKQLGKIAQEHRLQKSIDDYKRFADQFNKCGEIANKNGIRFAYHNHDYSFKAMAGGMPQDVLMNATDTNLVDFEMDIYWVVTAGADPIDWLSRYPNRFRLAHVKDRSKNPGSDNGQNSVVLGTGSIDFAKILKAGQKNGVKQWIVEQEANYGAGPLESCIASIDYLKKM
jgi:hypothetical protein